MISKWEFTKKSEKQFLKLNNQMKKRVLEKLDFWIQSGQPISFAENLTNYDLGMYRFRVGDYRLTFDVDGETITILSVGHRREIYK